jgi:hypothetical protein
MLTIVKYKKKLLSGKQKAKSYWSGWIGADGPERILSSTGFS